jgi:putative nucleotidyltransferase with HDIG domain
MNVTSRLVPVGTPGIRNDLRLPPAAWATLVVGASLGAFTVVNLTGGSPNPWNNLGYLSIVLGAYRFGIRGGGLAGLLFTFLIGPGPAFFGFHWAEPESAWVIRVAAYVGVGLLLGWLFERGRAALVTSQLANRQLRIHERETMLAMARGAEAKDTDTGEHVLRVQLVTEALAAAAGYDTDRLESLGWAAMLHDIGKLHVPDRILMKPGPLDPAERALIERHPIWGVEILGDGKHFALARTIARSHHENVDGSGYPDRLRGQAIPFEARIVRIADAFDAMTNDRPYRRGMSIEAALEELDRFAGRQFDPELVRLTIDLLRGSPALTADITRLSVLDRSRFS